MPHIVHHLKGITVTEQETTPQEVTDEEAAKREKSRKEAKTIRILFWISMVMMWGLVAVLLLLNSELGKLQDTIRNKNFFPIMPHNKLVPSTQPAEKEEAGPSALLEPSLPSIPGIDPEFPTLFPIPEFPVNRKPLRVPLPSIPTHR